MREGDNLIFSVFDMAANRNYWVAEGESKGVTVRDYDERAHTLSVEHQGRSLTLQLKQSTIQAGAPGMSPQGMHPGMPQPMPPGSPGAPVAEGGGAETRRLEAVAAEVRRRRALRAASAQQRAQKSGQHAPVPGVMPTPVPSQPEQPPR